MSDEPLPTPAPRLRAGLVLHDVIRGSTCSWYVRNHVARSGPISVLSLAGELDLFTRPTLHVALEQVLATGPHDLVVDLGHVTFCGIREAALLHDNGAICRERGVNYAVSAIPARMVRLFSRVWSREGPACYASVPAAVKTLGRG